MLILFLLGLIALVIAFLLRGIARAKNDRAWALAKRDAELLLEQRKQKFSNSPDFRENIQ
ncbi:MAG TPA: hypothetical protein VF509_07330 [Sphingobium sp.]